MGQVEERQNSARLGLYAHISRIYNSSVNAAIAVIFGWLAFVGFSMTLQSSTYSAAKAALILIGLVMSSFGGYFYMRIWIHGRYLAVMQRDLGLGDYLTANLRGITRLNKLNWRPVERTNSWTPGEIIGLAFLILSFAIPIIILMLR